MALNVKWRSMVKRAVITFGVLAGAVAWSLTFFPRVDDGSARARPFILMRQELMALRAKGVKASEVTDMANSTDRLTSRFFKRDSKGLFLEKEGYRLKLLPGPGPEELILKIEAVSPRFCFELVRGISLLAVEDRLESEPLNLRAIRFSHVDNSRREYQMTEYRHVIKLIGDLDEACGFKIPNPPQKPFLDMELIGF